MTTEAEALCSCLLEIERDMTGKIPFFFKNDSAAQLGIWLPYAVSFSTLYLTITKSLHAKDVVCKDVDIDRILSDNACICSNFVHASVKTFIKWREDQVQNINLTACNDFVAKVFNEDTFTNVYSACAWCYTSGPEGGQFKCDKEKEEVKSGRAKYESCVMPNFRKYWLQHASTFADQWKKLCRS